MKENTSIFKKLFKALFNIKEKPVELVETIETPLCLCEYHDDEGNDIGDECFRYYKKFGVLDFTGIEQ